MTCNFMEHWVESGEVFLFPVLKLVFVASNKLDLPQSSNKSSEMKNGSREEAER